jgi:hypothetical protein
MTATTTQANTDRMGTNAALEYVEWPMAGTEQIYAGAMAATNSSGYVLDATNTTGLKIWGRAKKSADNSSGSNGDIRGVIEMGVFKWKNKSGDALTIADRGKLCYASDNQTVAATSTGLSAAGFVIDIASDGDVWVLMGPMTFVETG